MSEQEGPYIDPSQKSTVVIDIGGEDIELEIEERQRRLLPYISYLAAILDDVRHTSPLIKDPNSSRIILSKDLRKMYLSWNIETSNGRTRYRHLENEEDLKRRLANNILKMEVVEGEVTEYYDEEFDQTYVNIIDMEEIMFKVFKGKIAKADEILSQPESFKNDIHESLLNPNHILVRYKSFTYPSIVKAELSLGRIHVSDL